MVIFSCLYNMATVAAGSKSLSGRSRKGLFARGELASVGEYSKMQFVVETGRLLRCRDFSLRILSFLSD